MITLGLLKILKKEARRVRKRELLPLPSLGTEQQYTFKLYLAWNCPQCPRWHFPKLGVQTNEWVLLL